MDQVINLDKLNSIVTPLSKETIEMMEKRKRNRPWRYCSRSIALKIKKALRDNGWDESDLVELLNLPLEKIKEFLTGDYNFDLITICNLEHYLDIKIINRDII